MMAQLFPLATCALFILLTIVTCQRLPSINSPVPGGFPNVWDGDKYYKHPINVKNDKKLPDWIDGYFFGQLCASYGQQSAPKGQKLTHMFDAISGLMAIDINSEQSTFTGKYYPVRPYHIWSFYNRNMSQSKVAWGALSSMNVSARDSWDQVASAPNTLDGGPNVDFWKIGTSILAGTENALQPGLTFDPLTTDNFRPFPWIDNNELFTSPNYPYIAMAMPIHERPMADGSLYTTIAAVDMSRAESEGVLQQLQFIVRIYPTKQRVVEAVYKFGDINYATDCDVTTGEYVGDKNKLSGYMHSISSTQSTLILPLTSVLFNPCRKEGATPIQPITDAQSSPIGNVDPQMPLRFLVYNTTTKQFITPQPIKATAPFFITHQWNAYETLNQQNGQRQIVADMLAYDFNVYNVLTPDHMLKPAGVEPVWDVYALRFTMNPDQPNLGATYSNLLPGDQNMQIEFSQTNHAYDGMPYKYGYVVKGPYRTGSSILKFNFDTPSVNPVSEWAPTNRAVSITEPWFVARPGATSEDDGVLMIKGSGPSTNKGVFYILDAKSMKLMVEYELPSFLPFGFHNRFYNKTELGLNPTEKRGRKDMDGYEEWLVQGVNDFVNIFGGK